MGVCSIVAEVARWSYFIVTVLSVMNSFIHLHIQFEMTHCSNAVNDLTLSGFKCIGRNLAWKKEDDFDLDTNKLLWRQVFSLSPDIFFDIWPPVILSTLALLQHFDTFKFEAISGDWGRAFIFIIAWQLFCVLGYGSNFGVIVGFIGLCGVAFLYLIMCILLFLGIPDTDVRDKPVLDFSGYLKNCLSLSDKIKQRTRSDAASVNHDNDNDNIINKNDNKGDNNPRLSLTQPGSVMYDVLSGSTPQLKNRKAKNLQYNKIQQNGGSSDSNDDEVKQNECNTTNNYNDNNIIPPPPPPPPPIPALPNTITNKPSETGNEIEFQSDSDKSHDGLYQQPDPNEATPR